MDHVLGMRERLLCNRTQLINQIRSYMPERGIVIPQGRVKFSNEMTQVLSEHWEEFGDKFQVVITESMEELKELEKNIAHLDDLIMKWSGENEGGKNLMSIAGIGSITAAASLPILELRADSKMADKWQPIWE